MSFVELRWSLRVFIMKTSSQHTFGLSVLQMCVVKTFSMMITRRDHRNSTDDLGSRKNNKRVGRGKNAKFWHPPGPPPNHTPTYPNQPMVEHGRAHELDAIFFFVVSYTEGFFLVDISFFSRWVPLWNGRCHLRVGSPGSFLECVVCFSAEREPSTIMCKEAPLPTVHMLSFDLMICFGLGCFRFFGWRVAFEELYFWARWREPFISQSSL